MLGLFIVRRTLFGQVRRLNHIHKPLGNKFQFKLDNHNRQSIRIICSLNQFRIGNNNALQHNNSNNNFKYKNSYNDNSIYTLSNRNFLGRWHVKPDPFHRVYRRAPRSPFYRNIWIERFLLLLSLISIIAPGYFIYYFWDGVVPITKRRRFLLLPLWLDHLVGTYSLHALGVIDEVELEKRQANEAKNMLGKIRKDMNIDNMTTVVTTTETQENNKDKNDNGNENDTKEMRSLARLQKIDGIVYSSDDERVAYIETIFKNLLEGNNILFDKSSRRKRNRIKYFENLDNSDEIDNNNSRIKEIEKEMKKFEKFSYFDWELIIIEDEEGDDVLNAMCVPGGKMVIHTGLLKRVLFCFNLWKNNTVIKTDDECAAVMAHEISHALCRHGVSQLQFVLFLIACFYGISAASGIEISGILGKLIFLTIRALFQLPMSRKFENEADEIAMYLLKFAGYDPYALVTLLENLDAESKKDNRLGIKLPEILSTHPLTDNRVATLKDKLVTLNQELP